MKDTIPIHTRAVRVALVSLAMTALALAFVWGCGDAGDGTSSLDSESAAEPRPSADATIKIGTILPSSGALSVTGPNSEVAIALAFEIVNEAGGVNGKNIEAIHRDSGTSEQLGTDAASGLINIHDVSVILGAVSSGVTVAIAESLTIPSGVLLVSPISSSNAITTLDDNDMVFRTSVSDAIKSQVAAELAHKLGMKRVASSYVNNAFGASVSRGFREHFEALGGDVVAEVSHELGQTTYASELRKASEKDAEALVAIAYTDTGYTLLREAVEGGYFDEFLFFSPLFSQDLFDTVGVHHFEGTYGVMPGAPLTDARSWFFDQLRERKGGDIDFPLISESFDAAMVVALAIEKADSEEPEAIRDALREVANPPGEAIGPQEIERALEMIRNGQDIDYVGASGEVDFDENGDVTGTIEIWHIADGIVDSADIFVLPGQDFEIHAANGNP